MVETMMVDACLISRDSERTGDDTWDSATGTYTRPTGDDATLYEGPCNFWANQQRPIQEPEGGILQARTEYFVEIPKGTPGPFQPEDVVTITAVSEQGVAEALGQKFLLDAELFYTYTASRIFRLHRLELVPND